MQTAAASLATDTGNVLALNVSPQGRWLRIFSLPEGIIRSQFIRFGIGEGERVKCIERLPGGTIVLQRNRQQLAVGHKLARQIFVIVIDTVEE